MLKNTPLVLVDGSSYLYRAFHALPPLANSKGVPTGAAKGVINMMRRAKKDWPTAQIVVVFDAKGKTFRDDMYEAYKSNRPPMPDDLRIQIEPIHQAIKAMGLPLLIVPYVEADDVIGTLALDASKQGRKVIVSTGDKDMAQLVDANVELINTMNDSRMDEQGVVEKFGVEPQYIIDYLALMGDKVDNIPGVAGVGEKTAVGLIQALGGINDIYNKLEEVKNVPVRGAKKLADKLLAEESNARLSYQLATIKTDVQLEYKVDDLQAAEPNTSELLKLYSELEFRSWVEELSTDSETGAVEVQDKPASEYSIILTEKELSVCLDSIASAELVAFDTETTSLNYIDARIVGVSFAVEPYKAVYIPFGHDYMDAPEQLSEALVLQALKPILEDESIKKVGQNLKYDKSVLVNHGITLRGIEHDTMLESYVLNSVASRHDMDTLAKLHLGEATIKFEDVAGKGKKQLTFNEVPLEQAGPYAAEDVDVTLRLHAALYGQLDEDLQKLYRDIEMPLLSVLSAVERTGALVDRQLLLQHSSQLGLRLNEIEQQVYEMAGQPFNLASPKQLGEILFEKLKLPIIKKTKKGVPSTAEEVLQELALDYPLPALLLEYRGLAKLKTTYTDKLPEMINDKTGRIHTSYHQAVTATGRLSSSDPNLQNIPIRNAEGRRIRQAFVAPEGYKLVAADYSQVELRIMAHLSGDENLLSAFNAGLDIHRATAAEVNGIALDEVSDEERRKAKAVNFGLIYGMSAFGLAKQLKVSVKEAQAYIDTYFERYPGVQQYMDRIRGEAKLKGYVETLMGRRLYLPEINSSNGMRRQAAERTAINAPMQGTAADIIKLAMLGVQDWLVQDDIDVKMVMQVHDELVFEVAVNGVDDFCVQIAEEMSKAVVLNVPLVVDVGVGDNWDQAH